MAGLPWQRRWDPFRELQREVGRLFESLEPFDAARQTHNYPPLNLYDAGDRYLLSVQLPGMTPSDIDLTITGETLTMRGERKRAEGVKDDSYRRQERPMGRWARTITLPDRVDSAPGRGLVCRRDPDGEPPQGGGCQAAADHGHGGGDRWLSDTTAFRPGQELNRINQSRELRNMNLNNPTIRVRVGTEQHQPGLPEAADQAFSGAAGRRTPRRLTSTRDPTV